METIAVLINDAAHARHMLLPMRTAAEPTHWILVACAPRLTRRIGRWVSHSQREHWRERDAGVRRAKPAGDNDRQGRVRTRYCAAV